MSFDSIFNGPPSSAGFKSSGQASLAIDVSTGNLYYRSPLSDGWKSAGGTGGSTTIPVVSFYPENYGAKADGSTDSTAGIQAAINAASVAGGNVMLAAGTYKTSAPLVISASNVNLIGVGPKAVSTGLSKPQGSLILNTTPSGDILQLTGTSAAYLVLNYLFGFSLSRSVQPVNPFGTTGTPAAIRYSWCIWSITENVWTYNCLTHFCATVGTNCEDMHFYNCSAYNLLTINNSIGWAYSFADSSVVEDCAVGACTYGMYSGAGFTDLYCRHFETASCGYGVAILGNSENVHFIGCVHDSVGTGYLFSNCVGYVEIIGGYIDFSGNAGIGNSPGIDIENSSGILVNGVQISQGSGKRGIYIHGTSSGNTIWNNGFPFSVAASDAITLDGGASNNTIGGNFIPGPFGYAISITGGSYNVVQGNVIYGASGSVGTSGIVLDATSSHNGGVNSINPAYVTSPVTDGGTNNSITSI